jgi:hypothetical protein
MIDLKECPVNPAKHAVFEELMSGAARPVFVFGRNKYAERVSRAVAVEAFIDDETKDASHLGKPVVRLADVPRNGLVVCCVVNARPLTALDRLKDAGMNRVIDYQLLSRLAPESSPRQIIARTTAATSARIPRVTNGFISCSRTISRRNNFPNCSGSG